MKYSQILKDENQFFFLSMPLQLSPLIVLLPKEDKSINTNFKTISYLFHEQNSNCWTERESDLEGYRKNPVACFHTWF